MVLVFFKTFREVYRGPIRQFKTISTTIDKLQLKSMPSTAGITTDAPLTRANDLDASMFSQPDMCGTAVCMPKNRDV